MPLPKSKNRTKKGINRQVSKNIDELVHHGTRKRSMKQIIKIAEVTARGQNKSRKKKSGSGDKRIKGGHY